MDEGVFLGRVDELRRWQSVLDASRRTDPGLRDQRSFVVVVHGIGGMGKSRLVRRMLQHAAAERPSPPRKRTAEPPGLLVDLEVERKRVPDRYPPLEGPSVGTLLYTLERTICEQFGRHAEEAFADFRGVLGQIIDVVRDADRIRVEAKEAGNELSADQRKGLESAAGLVGGLLGVAVTGQIVGASLAIGGTANRVFRGWRRARRQSADRESPIVPQRRIDLALDAERVLVRSFAQGLAQTAGRVRLVIAIDTGEIAARALSAIRDIAVHGGPHVVWLIAGRFDTPASAGYLTSTVGEFERAISSDRLAVIAISVFDRPLQRDYLQSRLPYRTFADDERASIDQATRGIPLGLSLVADMLRDGLSLQILDDAIDDHGEANLLIQGLTRRFLHHALHQPPGTTSALRDDLPAIFALVADETADSGNILGFPLQRRIRAALLGVHADSLSDRLDQLASRHDFVLAATGRIHDEVANVVRDYMLGSDQRHNCATIHERALEVIADELEQRFSGVWTGERMQDDAWRQLAAAYVRHAFWISNERGIAAVCCVLPAAIVLRPEFASVLRMTAARFYMTATNDEQRILRGLPWPQPSVFNQWLESRGGAGLTNSARIPAGDDSDARRANQILAAHGRV